MANSIDDIIRDIARRQHGVVARSQLLEAGVTGDAIRGRVRHGALSPAYRGVYLTGPVRGRLAREVAAALACGPGAAISYWSAARVRAIREAADPRAPVDVTVVGRDPSPGPGVRVHRVRSLEPDEVSLVDGLLVTTAARTLLDLSMVATFRELEQALARAEREGILHRDELLALIARRPRRRGLAVLRALLQDDLVPALTRSEAEELFLALIREAGIRRPGTNVRVRGFEVDFHWRAERVIVEIGGHGYHASTAAQERDKRRDTALQAAGYRVMRFTWKRLTTDRLAVVRQVSEALARG